MSASGRPGKLKHHQCERRAKPRPLLRSKRGRTELWSVALPHIQNPLLLSDLTILTGIVTKFDFYTANYDKVWFQVNVYNNTHINALLRALVTYESVAEEDHKAGFTFTPAATTTTVGFSYAAPQESPDVFKAFYGIPVLQVAVPSTIGTQNDLANTNAAPPGGPPTE